MIGLLAISSILIVFMIYEIFYCAMWRKKIGCVIHVNGIRGKTTVTRMIDAAIKESGYSSLAKTTGSEPTYILPSGEIVHIHRRGVANIREQIMVLSKAGKLGCDFLVVECMALNPKIQKISEKILGADITVITNIKVDHIGVLGFNKSEIAKSLLASSPVNGVLVLGKECENLIGQHLSINENYHVTREYMNPVTTMDENANMALTVCDLLNLDMKLCLKGVENYQLDIGHKILYEISDGYLVNGFSANDYESSKSIIEKYKCFHIEQHAIWYNHRNDRDHRMKLMMDLIIDYSPETVYISGEGKLNVFYKLRRTGYNGKIVCIKNCDEITFTSQLVIGIGNIKGNPLKLLHSLEEIC